MARSKDEINKSQAIREALKANRDKSPLEIAELLKAKGVEVNAQYVSTIKSNLRKASRAVRQVRRGIRKAGRKMHLNGEARFESGLQIMNAAVELLKVAGGIEQAKSALATIEKISQAMQ